MNLLWQILAVWSVLSILGMMTVLLYGSIQHYALARRLSAQHNIHVPGPGPALLARAFAVWLFILAITVFCFWCIFW
jgi:hypothetical protein